MNKLGIIALAVSAHLAAPAGAASFADASLRDFTITLYDLNPSDGIAPSITWVLGPLDNRSVVSGIAVSANPYQSRQYFNTGDNIFSPVRDSAATNFSRSAARISGAGGGQDVNGLSFRARGSTSGVPRAGSSFEAASFIADALPHGLNIAEFMLTPNTAVRFSGNASARAGTTIGTVERNGRIFGEVAQAHVALEVVGPGSNGEGNQFSGRSINLSAGTLVGDVPSALTGRNHVIFRPETFAEKGRLTAFFVNRTGAGLSGFMNLNAGVSGDSFYVSSVPEPESYAMLVAGLGLMGCLARRRKAAA